MQSIRNINLKKSNWVLYFRKKKLIKEVKKSIKLEHKMVVLKLLEDGVLDNYITLIDNEKIIIGCNSIADRGYISGREHFIRILDKFISYFQYTFDSLELLETVLPLCIKSGISDIFLSKKYLYDNDYIDFYIYNYNLMIVSNFYNNGLRFERKLKEELKKIGIKFKGLDFQNSEEIDKLVIFLMELCFVNKNNYALLSLFTLVDEEKYDLYLKQWRVLLDNYLDNMKFIREYRKFKERMNI